MKKMKAGLVMAAIVAVTAPGYLAAQAVSPADSTVHADGAGATTGRFDNLHMTRYIEIFLAHQDANTGRTS